MKVLLSLIPVLLISGMLCLYVITLRDAVKLPGSEKVAWICLIILLPLGSIIYIFVNPNKQKGRFHKHRHVIILGLTVGIVLLCISIIAATSRPTEHLKRVSFQEVVNQVENGQIKRIEVTGNELKITKHGDNKPSEKTRKEPGMSLSEQGLNLEKVEINNVPTD